MGIIGYTVTAPIFALRFSNYEGMEHNALRGKALELHTLIEEAFVCPTYYYLPSFVFVLKLTNNSKVHFIKFAVLAKNSKVFFTTPFLSSLSSPHRFSHLPASSLSLSQACLFVKETDNS
jgi:hypothetical protein